MELSERIVVDANTLKQTNVQRRQINEYVSEILQNINEEIHMAYQEGKQEFITELPIVFNITNMSENRAQTEIWSKIIDYLESKHYRIMINPSKNSCMLKISWLSVEDEAESKLRERLIRIRSSTKF
jgi:hypothetical protein